MQVDWGGSGDGGRCWAAGCIRLRAHPWLRGKPTKRDHPQLLWFDNHQEKEVERPPPSIHRSRLSLLKRALCLLRSEAAVHGAASGPAELGIRPSTIYQCYAFTDTKAARGRQAETSPRGSPARAIAELHSGGLIARRDP